MTPLTMIRSIGTYIETGIFTLIGLTGALLVLYILHAPPRYHLTSWDPKLSEQGGVTGEYRTNVGIAFMVGTAIYLTIGLIVAAAIVGFVAQWVMGLL